MLSLHMQAPVVSSAIPEVEVLGVCGIGHTPEEFSDRIKDAYCNPPDRRLLSVSMETESWEARVRQIETHFAALGTSDRSSANDAETG